MGTCGAQWEGRQTVLIGVRGAHIHGDNRELVGGWDVGQRGLWLGGSVRRRKHTVKERTEGDPIRGDRAN